MAFLSQGVAEAFRNNHHLQQFMLTDVTPTGKVLGTGSFGSVEEVKYQHLMCAGKKLHEALIKAGNEGVADVVRKYEQECQLMSSLRHPNITQFLGLCFLPGTQLPLLVMERLETSLDDLLEHMPGLPLSLKRSVLEDVASGLVYLHKRTPPVIHRDLTSRNVLLTSSLVAKITDMGNSRIINMRPGQMARTLTQLPGTLVYMPPEAMSATHHYGPSLDIFSFGHLALYTVTQIFPGNLLESTFLNPDNPQDIRARTELERRGEYIKLMENKFGFEHPVLVQLIKQCLHNAPAERPATEEVLEKLQRMRVEVEGGYGNSLVKLDLNKVLISKEMKSKDKRIEELTRQQERNQTELTRFQRETERLIAESEQYQAQFEVIRQELNELRADSESRERRLREELRGKEAEVSNLTEELRKRRQGQQQEEARKVRGGKQEEEARKILPLKLPLQLTWRQGQDMPLGMGGYVQSVVIQQTLYIGGGNIKNFSMEDFTVMEYDIHSEEWTKLSPYDTYSFAMTKINNQLVLVGGRTNKSLNSNRLGVWSSENKKWTHPYPEMPTAHSHCSAVAYREWLAVAGGQSKLFTPVSSVEIMNINSKQWHTGPSTPIPWSSMKSAIVGGKCYFMGGHTEAYTDKVYRVLLTNLFRLRDGPIWDEISGLPSKDSTPLSINGSLLALGGWNDRGESAEIHLYQPETGEWVKAGKLPLSRDGFTCALIREREILVAGGWLGYTATQQTYIGLIDQ